MSVHITYICSTPAKIKENKQSVLTFKHYYRRNGIYENSLTTLANGKLRYEKAVRILWKLVDGRYSAEKLLR